jgi:NAD(P)-dependent dehydrogenase (short-subunit alcohol dehydrogenase family)
MDEQAGILKAIAESPDDEQLSQVVVASRDANKGQEAISKLQSERPKGSVTFMQLDLANLASVRTFAAQFTKQFNTLDLLINDAGVMAPGQAIVVETAQSTKNTRLTLSAVPSPSPLKEFARCRFTMSPCPPSSAS